MNLKQGTFVKVLAGAFKDTVGVIEDIQPECSAVRIGTREGNAFAMLDAVQALPAPEDAGMIKPVKSPLRKK
jgi:hypothetical protein